MIKFLFIIFGITAVLLCFVNGKKIFKNVGFLGVNLRLGKWCNLGDRLTRLKCRNLMLEGKTLVNLQFRKMEINKKAAGTVNLRRQMMLMVNKKCKNIRIRIRLMTLSDTLFLYLLILF